MCDYTRFNREFGANYALVNFVTGEVRTMKCAIPNYALRALYKRLDGEMRLARLWGDNCHLVLANCCTGRVLVEIKRDFHREQTIAQLYDLLEG